MARKGPGTSKEPVRGIDFPTGLTRETLGMLSALIAQERSAPDTSPGWGEMYEAGDHAGLKADLAAKSWFPYLGFLMEHGRAEHPAPGDAKTRRKPRGMVEDRRKSILLIERMLGRKPTFQDLQDYLATRGIDEIPAPLAAILTKDIAERTRPTPRPDPVDALIARSEALLEKSRRTSGR